MSLIDVVKSWCQQNAEHLLLVRIPSASPSDQPLVLHQSYFRIHMAEAFLTHDREWFTDRHLAVHTTVRVEVADSVSTLTSVARPPEEPSAPGEYGNYPATPLIPFRGGTVSLTAGLTALKGRNGLAAAFEVLEEFSKLVPPLQEVVSISETLAGGVQKLLAVDDAQTVLGLHQAFVSQGGGAHVELTAGYWAVINTTQGTLDASALAVVDGHLHARDGGGTSRLTGRDYMMFRIEGRAERDDWTFARFDELYNKAVEAHFRDDQRGYEAYRNTLLSEVLRAGELTRSDGIRVAQAYKAHLAAVVAEGLGAVAEERPTLAQIIRAHAPSRDEVAGQERSTLDALLAPPS